jgi:hypothetical protein
VISLERFIKIAAASLGPEDSASLQVTGGFVGGMLPLRWTGAPAGQRDLGEHRLSSDRQLLVKLVARTTRAGGAARRDCRSVDNAHLRDMRRGGCGPTGRGSRRAATSTHTSEAPPM